ASTGPGVPGVPIRSPAREPLLLALRGRPGRLGRSGGQRHVDLAYARAVDGAHLEAGAVEGDGVAHPRHPAELAEHEAADRVIVVDRQALAEALVELVDRERPDQPHPAAAD